MSYVKIDPTIPLLADALACVAPEATPATQDAMLASGVAVQLDNGLKAWAASVVQDNPETPFTEILTVCLALNADDSIRLRSGNVPLHRVFWHAESPVTLERRGMDAVRRDLLLMALGEAPDDSQEPADVQSLNRKRMTERSIRVAVDIADAVAAPPTDVL